ncbi:MAG: SPOR domain-containing protein [Bdellovibrionota bacterium]
MIPFKEYRMSTLQVVCLSGIVMGCMVCAFYIGTYFGNKIGFENAMKENLENLAKVPIDSIDIGSDDTDEKISLEVETKLKRDSLAKNEEPTLEDIVNSKSPTKKEKEDEAIEILNKRLLGDVVGEDGSISLVEDVSLEKKIKKEDDKNNEIIEISKEGNIDDVNVLSEKEEVEKISKLTNVEFEKNKQKSKEKDKNKEKDVAKRKDKRKDRKEIKVDVKEAVEIKKEIKEEIKDKESEKYEAIKRQEDKILAEAKKDLKKADDTVNNRFKEEASRQNALKVEPALIQRANRGVEPRIVEQVPSQLPSQLPSQAPSQFREDIFESPNIQARPQDRSVQDSSMQDRLVQKRQVAPLKGYQGSRQGASGQGSGQGSDVSYQGGYRGGYQGGVQGGRRAPQQVGEYQRPQLPQREQVGSQNPSLARTRQASIQKGYYVQIASLSNEMDANILVNKVNSSGFKTKVQTTIVSGVKYYRVLSGPEDTHIHAQRMVEELKREPYITSNPFVVEFK